MYKKKKVEISFEVVEWVCDDDKDYQNDVNEWLDRLKTLVDCFDYRAEYEVDETCEYAGRYKKLISTGSKIEVTDAGCLEEDAASEDELWERYGDDGYYQFKVYEIFTDQAQEIFEDHHSVSVDDLIEFGALARKIAAYGI